MQEKNTKVKLKLQKKTIAVLNNQVKSQFVTCPTEIITIILDGGQSIVEVCTVETK